MKQSELYLIIANIWLVGEWLSTGTDVLWAFGIALCFIIMSVQCRLRNE